MSCLYHRPLFNSCWRAATSFITLSSDQKEGQPAFSHVLNAKIPRHEESHSDNKSHLCPAYLCLATSTTSALKCTYYSVLRLSTPPSTMRRCYLSISASRLQATLAFNPHQHIPRQASTHSRMRRARMEFSTASFQAPSPEQQNPCQAWRNPGLWLLRKLFQALPNSIHHHYQACYTWQEGARRTFVPLLLLSADAHRK